MEKDLIILCTAVTRPGAFAADKQRLNVALTRGRHHLLLIGHEQALQVGCSCCLRCMGQSWSM